MISSKNIRFIFSITLFLILLPHFCFADDIDYEQDSMETSVSQSSYISSSSTVSTSTVEKNVEVPDINSRAAVVIERSTNAILYGKNETTVRKMASTTKIMTAIVVLENKSDLSEIVTVSSKAASIGGSTMGLTSNLEISINDLLYGLMLCSGNDAAIALAEHVGGSVEGFADMMNKKAKELNLNNTHFVTPHGLDNDDHYTTAYELALLTNYALKNETFAKLVRTSNYTVMLKGGPKNLHNTNELLGYLNGVYGVKTGFTNGANRCLVTSCKRNDLDIICVVLGADTKKFRTQDSTKLIEYAFKTYQMVNLKSIVDEKFNSWKSNNLNSFTVYKGVSSDISVNLQDLPFEYYPVNIQNIDDISPVIDCNFYYEAPLPQNFKLGTLNLKLNDDICFTLDISNAYTINRKSTFNYLNDFTHKYVFYLENIF
ncbi:MAG: D-alanyl-D-alanine carboxypeptidase [Clostridia bacterium]|nr:D-alanyl-D-alanine carboxypeptidase [Clostridia bacterium]